MKYIVQVTETINLEIHPNIGQLYQRNVNELSLLLSIKGTRHEAVNIIRFLIERIDIMLGEKHGQPQVELVGGLAATLEFSLSKQQKTAIPSAIPGLSRKHPNL